jgi:hypothetical protein
VSWAAPADDGGKAVSKYQVIWDVMDVNAILSGANDGSVLYAMHEVQRIETTASKDDLKGTFRVSFEGEATPILAHDISAADLRTQLEALPTIGSVAVSRLSCARFNIERSKQAACTYTNGHQWLVTFLTNIGDVPAMQRSTSATEEFVASTITAAPTGLSAIASAGTLSGTTTKVSVKTLVNGMDGYEHQRVVLKIGDYEALTGKFVLSFGKVASAPLSVGVSALEMEAALNAIGTMGKLKVESVRHSDKHYDYNIYFLELLGNQLKIVATGDDLSGTIEVVEISPGRLPRLDSPFRGTAVTTDLKHRIAGLQEGHQYFVEVLAWNGVGETYSVPQYNIPATHRACKETLSHQKCRHRCYLTPTLKSPGQLLSTTVAVLWIIISSSMTTAQTPQRCRSFPWMV